MSVLVLLAPVSGPLVPITRLPDPVFAQKLAGDGVSIDPVTSTVVAPCDAEVLFVHPAAHAVNLRTPEGIELILHVGLDTVALKGEGFLPHVKAGDRVRAGDPLIEFAPDYVATHASSLLTQLIVASPELVAGLTTRRGFVVAGRDPVIEVTLTTAGRAGPIRSPGTDILTRDVMVRNPSGLHARPAAVLARASRSFGADVRLRRGDREVNAKSVTAVMGLEVGPQERITIAASGADAREAIEALAVLIENGLGELDAEPVAGGSAVAADSDEPAITDARAADDPQCLRGAGASPGFAIGRIVQLRPQEIPTIQAAGDPREERQKLERALAQAREQLDGLRAQLARKDATEAAIFAAHLELLEDPDLVDFCHELIAGGAAATAAWHRAFTRLAERLAGARTELFAGRAADVRDVGRRVLRLLACANGAAAQLPEEAIVVAEEISPSEIASFDRTRVRGLATLTGGRTSHVAILARSFELPAVLGIDPRALAVPDGTPAILDGSSGTLRLSPTPEALALAQAALARLQDQRRREAARAGELATTADGHRVEVVANIGGVAEAEAAMDAGAEGVGLLRSEFLFLGRHEPPSEDEQYDAYARCLRTVGGRGPVVIRTLDVGGDKPLSYLPIEREDNPFLGVRGIRLAAQYGAILRTQLRAILRAAAHGPVQVMFPMVATLEDWMLARRMLDEERARLGAPAIRAGIMIEVPSAALLADVFARDADFFSVGTNDLTQYTLAIDRGHRTLGAAGDALHPAVLRLIDAAARAAHAHGRWIGVCGDIASDPAAVPILIGLGIDELSVGGPAVASVKARVRELTRPDCVALAARALVMSTAASVRALVAPRDGR